MAVNDSAATNVAADTCQGVNTIAEFLGEKPRRIFYLCETGQIPAYKIGGRWYLRRSTYLRFVEERESIALGVCAAASKSEAA